LLNGGSIRKSWPAKYRLIVIRKQKTRRGGFFNAFSLYQVRNTQ
jgi:hypothetical protein